MKKRVLVAPSDWGMGHAARCVPIIKPLLARGHEVMIGGNHALLREAFPNLRQVPLTPYNMTYAQSPLCLMLKFPFMARRVLDRSRREHRELDGIISSYNIDIVISDQRFGCYSSKIRSIYISHQLCVKMPLVFAPIERIMALGLRSAAGRFNELWIPDLPGEPNLTGDLTRKYPLPPSHRYIGPLSRFAGAGEARDGFEKTDLLVMLSGPEPQRTLLEKKVLARIAGFKEEAVVLLGRPGTAVQNTLPSNIRVFPHLPADRMVSLLKGAAAVVCRGGYTTIMELAALKKRALLIPTPGQTEQEYLCSRLARMGLFAAMPQSAFNLEAGLKMLEKPGSPFPDMNQGLLEQAINSSGL